MRHRVSPSCKTTPSRLIAAASLYNKALPNDEAKLRAPRCRFGYIKFRSSYRYNSSMTLTSNKMKLAYRYCRYSPMNESHLSTGFSFAAHL